MRPWRWPRIVPDIVLLDINLPGMSGIEVARLLKRRHPRIGIVILTMHEDDEQLFNAIRVGAAAYCTKDVDPALIVGIIRRVARGEYLINENVLSHPFVASRVLDQFRELARIDQASDSVFSPLTPREVEILDCVARGNSNKEIAVFLGISDQTVKNHITSILRKLAGQRPHAGRHLRAATWLDQLEGDEAVGRNAKDVANAASRACRNVRPASAPGELLLQLIGCHPQHRRPAVPAGQGDEQASSCSRVHASPAATVTDRRESTCDRPR